MKDKNEILRKGDDLCEGKCQEPRHTCLYLNGRRSSVERNWEKSRKGESRKYTSQEKNKRNSYVTCDFKAVINTSNKKRENTAGYRNEKTMGNFRD